MSTTKPPLGVELSELAALARAEIERLQRLVDMYES